MTKFKRIGKIAKDFETSISKLDDSEKIKLIDECNRLSQTNCGFLMFELKNIVIERTKAFLRQNKALPK